MDIKLIVELSKNAHLCILWAFMYSTFIDILPIIAAG